MSKAQNKELINKLAATLKSNDRGGWTVPAGDLYPHQWLWDSCFISIGLRHLDIDRAQTEILNLLKGQWSNGMVPNIVFAPGKEHRRETELWRSYINPFSPNDLATSGITQPPMIAEAVASIGQKLSPSERKSWYQSVVNPLINYHQWLYQERDPHQEGLVINLHPWETGLDNSPPWISELRKHSMPWWITMFEVLRLDGVVNLVRRDTRHVPPGQRMSNIEALIYWSALRRLRRKAYNSEALLSRSLFAVNDITFNSILIRANTCLVNIAKEINVELPTSLIGQMEAAKKGLEQLWDEQEGQYFSRSFVSHKLIEEETIGTLMPLYSGAISKERAQRLVDLLTKRRKFALEWPVPSLPISSPYFDPVKYWHGPTWVNTNWLIIQGLQRYGYDDLAQALKERTIELVSNHGSYEYFDPLNGSPAGADNFSWTAALTIDLIKS